MTNKFFSEAYFSFFNEHEILYSGLRAFLKDLCSGGLPHTSLNLRSLYLDVSILTRDHRGRLLSSKTK